MGMGVNIIGLDGTKNLEPDAEGRMPVVGRLVITDVDDNPLTVTESGALRVSQDQLQFFEVVDGNALNTNVWLTSVSGMTVVQQNGFIELNSAAALTANAYAILQSIKWFQLLGPMPSRPIIRMKYLSGPQANGVTELGFGLVTTNSSPTDGVFLRANQSGEWRAVLSNAGNETSALIDPTKMPAPGNDILLLIDIVEDLARFYIADDLVAEVPVPAGLSYPTNAGKLPIFARVFNGASPPGLAVKLSIGQFLVVGQDVNGGESYDDLLLSLGKGGYQLRAGTFGPNTNLVNNTAPTTIAAASLSNTAAAYSKLDGEFSLAAFAPSAGNDWIVFAYQVPVGERLKIRGVSIETAVTGLAVVTATLLEWWMGVNASALSLATADSPPTSWSPRPRFLGMQNFAASAPIGTVATRITQRFEYAPIVDSGRWVTINLRCSSGAATASVVYRGGVLVDALHV